MTSYTHSVAWHVFEGGMEPENLHPSPIGGALKLFGQQCRARNNLEMLAGYVCFLCGFLMYLQKHASKLNSNPEMPLGVISGVSMCVSVCVM